MKYILQTDNETIEIPIIRSKRKTLGLEVKYDGTVNARVPMRAPREIIERFIREHEAWIIRKRQEWSLSGNNRDDMSGLPPIETKEGKALMLNWIMYPLSDLGEIRKRQEAIVWDALPELLLNEEELDFIEYYLAYRDQIREAHILLSCATVIDRLVRYDSTRYVICRGVKLVVHLLHCLKEWATELPQDAPQLMKESAAMIDNILHGSELEEVLEQTSDEEKRLSNFVIDKFDYLFRCTRLLSLKELLSVIYLLDVCRTAHRVAKEKNFCCMPVMVPTMDFSVEGVVHPFVKDAQPNSWQMSRGNICIFTGSNMAGKSTTLKALTLAVWLAHCGLPVPVKSMICPLYEGIYTSINLPDSLRDGRSHFMAEVLRIKEVMQKAVTGKRCLVVLDEMFRGTNAKDAFEASVAVNELLKSFFHCHFLISTHILEYAKAFEKDSSCCFYYMEAEIIDDAFVCPHRLLSGISEARVGYWVVKKILSDGLM